MKKLIIFTLIVTFFSCVDLCDKLYFNDNLNATLLTFNALIYIVIIIAYFSRKIHKNNEDNRMFH